MFSVDPMVCIAHVFNSPGLVHVRCDRTENAECLIYMAAVSRRATDELRVSKYTTLL
jgi:hypothetical protein